MKHPEYTVAKIAARCWGVTERGKGYPGHVFPTRKLAVAFAGGRCPHCDQRLPRTEPVTGPAAARPD